MKKRSVMLLELLEAEGPKLHGLLLRLTLRNDVAEDLMQELFVKLCGSKALERSVNPGGYIWRAAVNLAFDWRRKQRRVALPLDDCCEPISGDDSPLAELITTKQQQQILDAIEKLGRTSRQVCIMRYVQQESYEDMAEQFGKTPHQIRALCYKALTQLREILARQELPSRRKKVHNGKI